MYKTYDDIMHYITVHIYYTDNQRIKLNNMQMILINIYYDTYEVHNPCYPSQNNQVIKVIVQVDSVVSLINDGPNG